MLIAATKVFDHVFTRLLRELATKYTFYVGTDRGVGGRRRSKHILLLYLKDYSGTPLLRVPVEDSMGKGVRSLRLLTFFSSGRLARLASLGSPGVRYNMHGQNFSSGTA